MDSDVKGKSKRAKDLEVGALLLLEQNHDVWRAAASSLPEWKSGEGMQQQETFLQTAEIPMLLLPQNSFLLSFLTFDTKFSGKQLFANGPRCLFHSCSKSLFVTSRKIFKQLLRVPTFVPRQL